MECAADGHRGPAPLRPRAGGRFRAARRRRPATDETCAGRCRGPTPPATSDARADRRAPRCRPVKNPAPAANEVLHRRRGPFPRTLPFILMSILQSRILHIHESQGSKT
ncbi:unnamed protein product [Urochloa humidicola]